MVKGENNLDISCLFNRKGREVFRKEIEDLNLCVLCTFLLFFAVEY